METSHQQNDTSAQDEDQDLQRHDSMPDLEWPEKKSNDVSNIVSSESHDTGFGSDTVGDISSPLEESKSISESVNQNETEPENSAAEDELEQKKDDSQEEDEMDILGNGLLVKKVLIPGKGVETRPKNGDTVTLVVDGVLEDGTHVDTGEISFILNDGDVIIAFDLAVALMEMGEKCELKTAPRYAYGDQGREPDIPKDARITYTLELCHVEPAVQPSLMSYDQRLKFGEAKRERGNYLYSRGDFTGAISSYGKATKLLDDPELNAGLDEASRCMLADTWVKCYNNMAACQLKIEALDAAIRSCEKVIATQEENVKALFRLGKAHGAKGNVDVAMNFLRQAIRLDPESKIMHQEMLKLSRRKTKEAATEKELYQRMLGIKPGENPFLEGKNKKTNSANPFMKWTLFGGTLAAVIASVGWTWYRTSWS
ncbi:peptidylprolyl isomerase [Plakobranchus ocellatus]|uniref:peptidylprolyl isomerase n=1 Tax=Plakobranchus ocellatus TaxID=259542 RepID=A0AAV4CQL6_9GAST|nr:peptidylprolyl isomerase [Plakobranchus ocellatus]